MYNMSLQQGEAALTEHHRRHPQPVETGINWTPPSTTAPHFASSSASFHVDFPAFQQKVATTRLLGKSEVVSQADLLAVITAPGAAQRPVHELFEFHRPKQVQRSQASSVLKLSSAQHDIMYALSGCWDVCSTLSKVNDQVRNALVSLYGIEKPAIITWFKNRRLVPKTLAAAAPTTAPDGPRASMLACVAGPGAPAATGLPNGLPGGLMSNALPSPVRSEPLPHQAQPCPPLLPRPPPLVMQSRPQHHQLQQEHEFQQQQLLQEQQQQRFMLQQQQEQQQQLQLQLLQQQNQQQRFVQQQHQPDQQLPVPSLFQQAPAPAIIQASALPLRAQPSFSPIWSLDQSAASGSLDLNATGARGALALQQQQPSIPWQSKASKATVFDLSAGGSGQQGYPASRQGYSAGHVHISSQQLSMLNAESQLAGMDAPMAYSSAPLAYGPPFSAAPNHRAALLNLSSGSSGVLSLGGSGSGNSMMGIADVPASWSGPGGAQVPQFQQTAVMWDTLQWEGQPISLKYLPLGVGEAGAPLAVANAGTAQQPPSPFAWAAPNLPSSVGHQMYKVIGQIVGVVNNPPNNSNM